MLNWFKGKQSQSKGNPKELQRILNEIVALDYPRTSHGISLYQQALENLPRKTNPLLWANIQSILADCLVNTPTQDQAEKIERAFYHLEQASDVFTRQAYPTNWALIQYTFGCAFKVRIRGERADNIEQAIKHFAKSLEVYTPGSDLRFWVWNKYHMGNAYSQRIVGNPSDNLEKAIRCLEEALEVSTPETLPDEWRLIQKDLAIFYENRVLGDSAENLKQAEYHYQQTLEVSTSEKAPKEQQPQTTQANDLPNELIEIVQELVPMLENGKYSLRRLELHRKAVELCTREMDSKMWAEMQYGFADSLQQTPVDENVKNLEQAIHYYQLALEVLTRESYPERWAAVHNRLGEIYQLRIQGDKAENVEYAIQHFEQTLQVKTRQANPSGWAEISLRLARTYQNRIRGNRAENIEKAIEHYENGLQVITQQAMPGAWAEATDYLGASYVDRVRGDHEENVEKGIHCFQQTLEVRTRKNAPKDWAATQHNLGIAYKDRVRGNILENHKQAIQHFQQALEVRTRKDFPAEWATTQHAIAMTYFSNMQGDRAESIEQAIHHYQQALEIRTRASSPFDWANTMDCLGMAYADRIRGNRAENIEQAIHHFEQVLELTPREASPNEWAATQQHLGNMYKLRIAGDYEENVEKSLYHCQQALEVLTREGDPMGWASVQQTLANTYMGRPKGKRAENIDQAIHYYQQVLDVRTRSADPDGWAGIQDNLAVAYRNRSEGDQAENIDKAIHYSQQALEVYTMRAYPEDWARTQANLANTYEKRILGDQAKNIEQAIHHYQQALKVRTHQAFPGGCRDTASDLGDLAFKLKRWELARDSYAQALTAQEVLMQASFTQVGKQVEILEMQDIPAKMAYLHLQFGEVEKAVEVLENGRAQLLRESQERQRRDLEQLPALGFEKLYKDYLLAIQKYDHLQELGKNKDTRPADWLSQIDNVLEAVQTAAAAIREKAGKKYPQYRYFQQAMPFAEIQKLAVEKPLVYLVTTSVGGFALVVTRHGVLHLKLPLLNEKSLQEYVWGISDEEKAGWNKAVEEAPEDFLARISFAFARGYVSGYRVYNMAVASRSDKQAEIFKEWQSNLSRTTAWLWDAVMHELINEVKVYANEVVLIPTGILALLPLHAAWTEDDNRPTGRRYALDELLISYTPSAHALRQSLLEAGRPTNSLMIVNNPDGSLLFAADEVQAVQDVFEPTEIKHFSGEEASLDAVKAEMQKSHILHFSTHGKASWGETHEVNFLSKSSGAGLQETEQFKLLLADGSLTLSDIFGLDLDHARLAVLSACETGVPGLELIEEVVGLPAGMMQAGVPGVIGSMWQVADKSTAMLMARFYMLWRLDGQSPQEALRQAQIWLRDSTTGEKTKFFKQIAKGQATGMHAETAMTFYQHIALDDPDVRAFESPFYWAAFAYTGV